MSHTYSYGKYNINFNYKIRTRKILGKKVLTVNLLDFNDTQTLKQYSR